jgi:hypothetical protein
MLPNATLPALLVTLLAAFESCFTAPPFQTFCALMTGLVAQTGRRTVCGILAGAGLSRMWGAMIERTGSARLPGGHPSSLKCVWLS